MTTDTSLAIFLFIFIISAAGTQFYRELTTAEALVFLGFCAVMMFFIATILWEVFSKPARERRKRIKEIKDLPPSLVTASKDAVLMGKDLELKLPIYLTDHLRARHVHIVGATGSGKTESVILSFIKQDAARGLGAIILDAKGDASFIRALRRWVPEHRLKLFDLGNPKSLTYNPLASGMPLEAAQRLFSSLNWSEEYYKSKANSVLQRLFQRFFRSEQRNPTLTELASYLDESNRFLELTGFDKKSGLSDFSELSGLRDQVKALTTGHLADILSPNETPQISLEQAAEGAVIYFRLQSLMSPQVVATLGKLVINHLNYLAGSAHRSEVETERRIVPTYFDEFASFACPEFADLISKARSAGMALHFSHQSIGDLADVQNGFLSRITDSSATKIILRVNDPDSAEFFARSFGTRVYQKITQRVTNAHDQDTAQIEGEGSQRSAHQFRSAPDVFKTLPTGVGSVLISHGEAVGSSVFRIQFPRLETEVPKL